MNDAADPYIASQVAHVGEMEVATGRVPARTYVCFMMIGRMVPTAVHVSWLTMHATIWVPHTKAKHLRRGYQG